MTIPFRSRSLLCTKDYRGIARSATSQSDLSLAVDPVQKSGREAGGGPFSKTKDLGSGMDVESDDPRQNGIGLIS